MVIYIQFVDAQNKQNDYYEIYIEMMVNISGNLYNHHIKHYYRILDTLF